MPQSDFSRFLRRHYRFIIFLLASMLAIIPLLVYIIWVSVTPVHADADCVISIKYGKGDLKEPQPLILKLDNKNMTIVYPDNNNEALKIPTGDSIYLACPGKNNYLKNPNWGNEAKAVCVKDRLFTVNGERYNFSSFVCNYYPMHDARYMDSSACLDRHTSMEIGFNVSGAFVRTIELCRDDKTYRTYFTKFKMTEMIRNSQKGFPRPPKFIVGDYFYGIDLDGLYKFETQLYTITKILNSAELAEKRMKKSVQFLSRGHLAAKADFVYGAMQRATFWYLNTAPQWQSFNGGNWNSLELSVRHFVATNKLNLDVYTGVHGQMTMKDIDDTQQPIYLDVESRIVSVPKFYWKIIYDPLNKRGTAFVGLNDPFIESITDDVYICKDISEKISWLNWKPYDITGGISYACSIDDLRETVPDAPKLNVTDILI